MHESTHISEKKLTRSFSNRQRAAQNATSEIMQKLGNPNAS
jgi:hypothetical protein